MMLYQFRAQLAIDHERGARHPPCADHIIYAFRFNRSASFSRTSAPDKAQSLMREPKCAMPSPTMKRYDKSFIGMRAGSIGSIAPCFAPVIMTTRSTVARPCSMAMSKHSLPGCRSEEHPSELPSLMRTSYAVFCLKNKKNIYT